MDDLGIWSKGSLDDHMLVVNKFLMCLAQDGMKCNLLTCKLTVKEATFGVMMPDDITHIKNEIDAVLKIGHPQNQTAV